MIWHRNDVAKLTFLWYLSKLELVYPTIKKVWQHIRRTGEEKNKKEDGKGFFCDWFSPIFPTFLWKLVGRGGRKKGERKQLGSPKGRKRERSRKGRFFCVTFVSRFLRLSLLSFRRYSFACTVQ